MKRWLVGVPPGDEILNGDRYLLSVEADDVQVQDETLIFYLREEDSPSVILKAFAPGHWTFVSQVDENDNPIDPTTSFPTTR